MRNTVKKGRTNSSALSVHIKQKHSLESVEIAVSAFFGIIRL